jgi:hypothetical protein
MKHHDTGSVRTTKTDALGITIFDLGKSHSNPDAFEVNKAKIAHAPSSNKPKGQSREEGSVDRKDWDW